MSESKKDRTKEWLEKAIDGDQEAMNSLMAVHRQRLKRMIELRMSEHLRGRVDGSDVLQEAFVEVARTLKSYLDSPDIPFYLWLRQIVARRLIDVHRRHLGTAYRDVRREIRLSPSQNQLGVDCSSMAVELSWHGPSPQNQVMLNELKNLIHVALDKMDPIDREVLALRHFEQLSNSETAQLLGIEPPAASKRYTRALERLKRILGRLD